MNDSKECDIITKAADQILDELNQLAREKQVELPHDVELVLEIIPQDKETICGYYFINHSCRLLFWLEEFDAEDLCDDVRAVVSVSHLRECTFDLWVHVLRGLWR